MDEIKLGTQTRAIFESIAHTGRPHARDVRSLARLLYPNDILTDGDRLSILFMHLTSLVAAIPNCRRSLAHVDKDATRDAQRAGLAPKPDR